MSPKDFLRKLDSCAEKLHHDNASSLVEYTMRSILKDLSKVESSWADQLTKLSVDDKDINQFILEMRWQIFASMAARVASDLNIAPSEVAASILRVLEMEQSLKVREYLKSISLENDHSYDFLN